MYTSFLHDMSAYCAAVGIKPETLGFYAVNQTNLFKRLKNGGRCWPETMERVYAYMREHPAPSTEDDAA